MQGLTAKVFRTYNASKTLQDQLDLLTESAASVPEKILAYNRANRQVALLCNHQRSIPKTFGKSMETLKAKVRPSAVGHRSSGCASRRLTPSGRRSTSNTPNTNERRSITRTRRVRRRKSKRTRET
jgi:hypothetical protein